MATYRNRLAERLKEYTEAKAVLASMVQATDQREEALNIKEHLLDKAEEQMDERETTIDHPDTQLLVREEDVVRREGILDRLTDEIGKLISDVADRLGVGKSLRAIRNHLTLARKELSDDRPSLG